MIYEVGFASKQEAIDAEAKRRTEELQKYELAKTGAGAVADALPTTLGMLFGEFFRQHAEEKLAPKTIERYREMVDYLAPELLAMPLGEITPLHLSREWNRLLKSGGHHRKTKQARPLSAKTVRHIAGLVSSAFGRAETLGTGHGQPGQTQRAAGSQETARHCTHASAAGSPLRLGKRSRGVWRRSWNLRLRPVPVVASFWRCVGPIFKTAAL